MTSSLFLENKEHKKEHFQLKVLFVSENKEQNGHFSEEFSLFQRTKVGNEEHQFQENKEGNTCTV